MISLLAEVLMTFNFAKNLEGGGNESEGILTVPLTESNLGKLEYAKTGLILHDFRVSSPLEQIIVSSFKQKSKIHD